MKMKKMILTAAALSCMSMTGAQVGIVEKLPAVDFNRETTSVMTALKERKSVRECDERPLTQQDLADVIWAANGINRPEEGRRTAPSSLNVQDIDIYAFTAKGVYLYEPKSHALKTVETGDHRKLLAGKPSPARKQDYVVKFPLILLFVSDLSRIGSDGEQARLTAAMDAAFVSENVNLFCAGAKMVTVTRASMDRKGIIELLKLNEKQLPMLNNAVGYPQK